MKNRVILENKKKNIFLSVGAIKYEEILGKEVK